MHRVSIVYFSQAGTTALLAEAIGRGARADENVDVALLRIRPESIHEGRWQDDDTLHALADSDTIVFGAPTYMGGGAAQFKAFADATAHVWYQRQWKHKLAAGFTISDAVADLLKLPVELLRLRPDVRAAGERMQAAGDHFAAARASRFPQFTLGLLGGFERGVDGPTWSISTQLLQPLFDFGRIRSRIEGADARLAQSRLAYDAALRQAARDSQTAIHAYGQGLIRLQHLDQATAAAERAARLARRQYEAGTVSMLEVLDAERSLFDIQRSQALATSELGQHWIDIYHTLGVGPALRPEEENEFHSDVVTVSAGPAAP